MYPKYFPLMLITIIKKYVQFKTSVWGIKKKLS